MNRKKMSRNIGFLDIVLRDEYNNPIYKSKRRKFNDGVKEFENFCKDKLGIHPFDTKEFEKKLEKKYGIKGVGFK